MSERGSYVTEYIYCKKCVEGLKGRFGGENHKFFSFFQIPSYFEGQSHLPIFAGKIGGLGSCDELLEMDVILRGDIESVICHPLKIAVMSDCDEGKEILTYEPK